MTSNKVGCCSILASLDFPSYCLWAFYSWPSFGVLLGPDWKAAWPAQKVASFGWFLFDRRQPERYFRARNHRIVFVMSHFATKALSEILRTELLHHLAPVFIHPSQCVRSFVHPQHAEVPGCFPSRLRIGSANHLIQGPEAAQALRI